MRLLFHGSAEVGVNHVLEHLKAIKFSEIINPQIDVMKDFCMHNIKSFFHKRCEIIAKSRGITRLFAYGEMVCFPVSVGVIGVVAGHSLLVLLMPLLGRMGIDVVIPSALPTWFVAIFVSAAIGYLTNYIAIQMLYYPVDEIDLGMATPRTTSSQDREALFKSRIISFVTFGFWKKGLIPQNKGKVARQMGRIAEEKFMTAENIAYLVPKLGNLFLSKNSEGKIRGVEFIRQLVVRHKDKTADLLQWIGREVVSGDNYQTIRNVLAKVGRSEAVSNALSAALFDYMEKNPDAVVSFVREMVTGFTDSQNRKAAKSDSLWEQFKAGATSVIVEGVAEIGYPQIRTFLEEYAKTPLHREQFRDRLASLLPIFCDKIAEKIVSEPQLLEQFVSGDFVSQLIHIDIADDKFWNMISEKVAPGLHAAIGSALESIPKEQFEGFFTGNHHIADVVERTILNMKLLDFYGMLDEVMAEHLGAIQVFGFVLGAAIGYIQYSVSMIAKGCSVMSYLLLVIPLVVLASAKICANQNHTRNVQDGVT